MGIMKNAEAEKKAAENNLPKLSGSEKQIAWANTIRMQFYEKYSNGQNDIATIISEKTESKFWIDNRNYLDSSFIEEYAEKIKEKQQHKEMVESNAVWPKEIKHDGIVEIVETDQPERAICAEIIREKALHALNDEVPHGIAVGIDRMKTRKTKSGSIIDMDATNVCERDSHKGIIIGKQGSMLKKIGTNARYEMERLLDCKVNLKLWVKVKKDWRDSDFLIKNFGYKEEE